MPGLKSLPLEGLHTALAARFGEFAGWRMPLWYAGSLQEHLAVRGDAGVFDISHMGRFRIEGPGVARQLGAVISRDPARLRPGSSAYALACDEQGGIIDDLLVYCLDQERYLVICNAANAARIGEVLRSASDGDRVRDAQAESVLIAVQGPAAAERLDSLLPFKVSALPRRGCSEATGDRNGYFVARTGYTGEDGFELIMTASVASELFKRLVENQVIPCGLAARDSLRLEAALALYASDISESTTPWEAGLGWAIDPDHEFRGRRALESQKGTSSRKLSCILADGQGVFRAHQAVYEDSEQVAEVTSGGFSPMLQRSIAMAYLPARLTRTGTELCIDVRGRRVPCHTVRRPFYSRRSTAAEAQVPN